MYNMNIETEEVKPFTALDLEAAERIQEILTNAGIIKNQPPEDRRKNSEQSAAGIASRRESSDTEKQEYLEYLIEWVGKSKTPDGLKTQAQESIREILSSALGLETPVKSR